MEDPFSWLGGIFMLLGFLTFVVTVLLARPGHRLRWGVLVAGLACFMTGYSVHLINDGVIEVDAAVRIAPS